MSSEDEFPDDFAGINWDTIDIPALWEAPRVALSTSSSTNSSAQYLCDDDEIDDAFLAEVDALEERATQATFDSFRNVSGSRLRTVETSTQATSSTRSASSPRIQLSRFFLDSGNDPPPHKAPCSPTQKRDASLLITNSPSQEKGKMKTHQDTDHVAQILEGFEHEMICPICCDIFIATHLGNPCGHSFCGECGLKWIANNRTPTCAVCRSTLSPLTPMIPNFVVDNTVDKYVGCLASSGNVDWRPGGAKLLEWTARKEQWKKGAAARASGARLVRPGGTGYNPAPLFGGFLDVDDDFDETYEPDVEVVAINGAQAPGRRMLRSRTYDAWFYFASCDPPSDCMHISFSPAVDQIVPITVLPLANRVQLHFTATLISPEDYNEFKRDKVKIQVWSDIPARGRVAGEWGELTFEEENPFNGDNSTVSLLSEDTDQCSNKHTLCLDCTVPLLGQTRFAYTYRLVYPSGEIMWLGQFGQNGALVLEHTLSDSRLSLGEGWRLDEKDSGAYLWHNNEPANVEVARLDSKDCSVWAIGPESSINDTRSDSSVVIFVPHMRTDCVALPQTFVLSASSDSSISMTPLGGIRFTTSGGGSLLLRTYTSTLDPQTFADAIVSHSGISPLRLVGCDEGHVVLTSPENIYPVSAVVIPLSPIPSSTLKVSVPLQRLSALLPSSSHVCIASCLKNKFYFFAIPSADQMVTFAINAAGGQFILAPAHCLGSAWHISILTPYKPAPPPVEPENKLPTPPSSPELYPVIPRETSSMLVPSLLDLNGEVNVEMGVAAASLASSPVQTAEAASAQTHTIAAQLDPGNGVLLYMRYIYAVLLKSFIAIIFPFFHNNMATENGNVDEQTPLFEENAPEQCTPNSVNHTSGVTAGHHSSAAYTQTNEIDIEPNVSLPLMKNTKPISPSDSSLTDSPAPNLIPVVSVVEPSEYEPSPADSPAESEPELTPFFMDTPGGTVSVILRALRSSTSADEVGIELDGTTVDRSVEKFDEGVYSVKFNAGVNGGNIKIFAASL